MRDSLIAIVPAAGVGQRAGRPGAPDIPKQYRLLAGEPMLRRAVRALLADARIAQVRVAVSPGAERAAPALAGLPRTSWQACRGATRAPPAAPGLTASGARHHD